MENKRKQERIKLHANMIWILFLSFILFMFCKTHKKEEVIKCGKNPNTIVVYRNS